MNHEQFMVMVRYLLFPLPAFKHLGGMPGSKIRSGTKRFLLRRPDAFAFPGVVTLKLFDNALVIHWVQNRHYVLKCKSKFTGIFPNRLLVKQALTCGELMVNLDSWQFSQMGPVGYGCNARFVPDQV
jgi:hypothetical protein